MAMKRVKSLKQMRQWVAKASFENGFGFYAGLAICILEVVNFKQLVSNNLSFGEELLTLPRKLASISKLLDNEICTHWP